MSSDGTRPFEPVNSDGLSDTPAAPEALGKILSIENVAEAFGISRWTLRYCELRGLVRRRRRIGEIRAYSWADCDRIAFLIKCRKAGLRFVEAAAIVRALDDDSALIHESAQERCLALVERLEQSRRTIDEALSELGHIHSLLGAKLAGEDGTQAD